MSYGVVAHTSTGGTGSQTTSAINTTGASLLVIVTGSTNTTPSVSDSKGNTWVALTVRGGGLGNPTVLASYVINPTVGSGHTFSINATGDVAVIALSGAKTSGVFDVENGSVTKDPGSITPSENNEIVLTCYSGWVPGGPTSESVDSGFTLIESSGLGPQGIALAYKIQTTGAAVDPVWSDDGDTATFYATAIASFKAAAAASVNSNFFAFF